MKPLLTDFGFAKHLPKFSDLNRTFCGSSAYAPIEILKGKTIIDELIYYGAVV